MMDLVARLVGGAVQPLIDRIARAGVSVLRRLVLFIVAAICFAVVLIALTIAFDLWIASMAGPIVGALAVAGVYLVAGAISGFMATRGSKPEAVPLSPTEGEPQRARTAQIDQFIAPLLDMLRRLGLRREQLAVMAGASVAKQLKPVPLVGLAIIAGFVFGRLWKGWDALLSLDVVTALLSMFGMPQRDMDDAEPEDIAA